MMTRIQEIAAIPGFGESAKIIREEFDPLWGLEPSDKKIYHIQATETTYEEIAFDVLANSEEEAVKLADKHLMMNWSGDTCLDEIDEADEDYVPKHFSKLVKADT